MQENCVFLEGQNRGRSFGDATRHMVLYVFNVYSITSCAPVLVIRAQLSSLGFHCFLRVCMGSCVCFLRVHVCSGVGSGRCVCQVAPRGSRWETARDFLGHLVLRPHTHNSSIAMSAPAHTPYPFWLTGHPHGRGGRAWLVLVASAALPVVLSVSMLAPVHDKRDELRATRMLHTCGLPCGPPSFYSHHTLSIYCV